MFANELKESTMRVHQQLEKRLITHIKSIDSIEDYVQLLRVMYGFYAPIQDRLHHFIKHDQRHANNILDDIRYLTGAAIDKPAVSSKLPDVHSYHSALGVMYVTEGSTLGGVIIAGMISKKLGRPAKGGFSFFNAYGEETKGRWEKFREVLNGPFSPAEQNEMKTSAIATFSTFDEWISNS